jgi:hypothetical protein
MEVSPLYEFITELNQAAKKKHGSNQIATSLVIDRMDEDISGFKFHAYLLSSSDIDLNDYDDFLSQIQFLVLSYWGNVLSYGHNGDLDLAEVLLNYYLSAEAYIQDKLAEDLERIYEQITTSLDSLDDEDVTKIFTSLYIVATYDYYDSTYNIAPEAYQRLVDNSRRIHLPISIKDMIAILKFKGNYKSLKNVRFYFLGTRKPLTLSSNDVIKKEIYGHIKQVQLIIDSIKLYTGWDEQKSKNQLIILLEKLLPSIKKFTGVKYLIIGETYKYLVTKNVKPIIAGCLLFDFLQPFLNELDSYEIYQSKDSNHLPKSWEWNQYRHREIQRISGINRRFS